jgi:hypothetical protein
MSISPYNSKETTKIVFLISLNENARGKSVNHVTNHREWQRILTSARANGWKPSGTILDYEFQYQLEVSECEELNFDKHFLIDQYVKDKCGRWKGGYLISEYQIVTDPDARGIRKALGRTSAPLDFLLFLSYGAFRIAE